MSAPPHDRVAEVRPLATEDGAAVRALLGVAGGEATYVANDIGLAASRRQLGRRGLGVFQRGRLAAVCWFGGRANLMILAQPGVEVDAERLADGVRRHGEHWRIALGPPGILAVLAQERGPRTRILRTQIFCEARREAEVAAIARPMRTAVRPDLDWLVAAAVELNRADLGLEPDEVGVRWIREAARARLRTGTTFVVGARGAPIAKLDLGSTGSAGTVIEGVFTEPSARGQGIGAGLVAAVCARELRGGAKRVLLHVDRDNAPARACYARAGMRELCESGLLLRDG